MNWLRKKTREKEQQKAAAPPLVKEERIVDLDVLIPLHKMKANVSHNISFNVYLILYYIILLLYIYCICTFKSKSLILHISTNFQQTTQGL